MYNFNHLYYFYTCTRIGNISKAAVYLKTSQPSLSIQIKTLEEFLEMKLLIRNGRNLELTESGRIIYEYCEKIFGDLHSLNNFVTKKKNVIERESIHIGVSEQIERPFIADILGNFIKKYKKNEIPKMKMQTLPSTEMLSALKLSKMDIVITHEYISNKNFKIITIESPVALVGTKKFIPKNSESRNDLKKFLKNYNDGAIIPIDSFKLRTETELFLSDINQNIDIVFESGNLSANIRAIIENVGIGFMPILYVIKEINSAKLSYIMPNEGLWKHLIYIYVTEDGLKKKSVQELLDILEESNNSVRINK